MKVRLVAFLLIILFILSGCGKKTAELAETTAETVAVTEISEAETEEKRSKALESSSEEKTEETTAETTETETTRAPADRNWFETDIPYAWCEDQPVFMAFQRDSADPDRITVFLNRVASEVFSAESPEERKDGELFYLCESGSILEYCPEEGLVKLTQNGERHSFFPDRSGYDFTKYYLLSELSEGDRAVIGRLFTVTCYDWDEESRKKYLYKEGYAYINIEKDGSTWYYGGETVYVPGLTLVNKTGDGGPTLIVYFGDGRVHNVTIHDLWFDVENMPEVTRTNADGSTYTDTTWKFLYWGTDGPVTADSE